MSRINLIYFCKEIPLGQFHKALSRNKKLIYAGNMWWLVYGRKSTFPFQYNREFTQNFSTVAFWSLQHLPGDYIFGPLSSFKLCKLTNKDSLLADATLLVCHTTSLQRCHDEPGLHNPGQIHAAYKSSCCYS